MNTTQQRKGKNHFFWRIWGLVLVPPSLVLIVEVLQVRGLISRKSAEILALLVIFVSIIFIRVCARPRQTVKSYRRLLSKSGFISLSPEEQRKYLRDIVVGLAADAQHGLKPKYFIGPDSRVDTQDRHKLFDTDRMIEDFSAQFPSISKEDVKREVMSIYYYLLR